MGRRRYLVLDTYADEIIKNNINMSVPYYLMASYAYYVEDDPIFSDAFYDELAKTILAEWNNITHWHRDVINKDALGAGSFLGEYPSIVEGALKSLREQSTNSINTKIKTPEFKDTMGAFGGGLFDWGD
jgi:hypothetical protein